MRRPDVLVIAASWLLIFSSPADALDVIQITDNDREDRGADVSGSNVVWYGYDGSDHEIYLWDGVSITQLTDNSIDDLGPVISGSTVVWRACEAGSGGWCSDGGPPFYDSEIFLWDGASITQLTDNDTFDSRPAISGSTALWDWCDVEHPIPICEGRDYEISLWDGVSTTRITDNDSQEFSPKISGSNVVWYYCEGGTFENYCLGEGSGGPTDYEIHLWDGSTTTRITGGIFDFYGLDISGSKVVWSSCEGLVPLGLCDSDYEIYLWENGSVTNISNNSILDREPVISGSNVAWVGCDGDAPYGTCEGGDWEIYLWDGVTVTQITDNDVDDGYPQLSGSTLVWEGYDGNDYEIYMVNLAAPVPSISLPGLALLAGLMLGAAGWLTRRRLVAPRRRRRDLTGKETSASPGPS